MGAVRQLKKVGWVEITVADEYQDLREEHGLWPAVAHQVMAVTGQVNAQVRREETEQLQIAALNASSEYAQMSIAEGSGFVALVVSMALLGLPGWWVLLALPGFVAGPLYLHKGRGHFRKAQEHMAVVREFEGKGPYYVWPGDDDERMTLMVGVPLSDEEE
jgi:hypothetical protein